VGEYLAALSWRDALDLSLLFVISYGAMRLVRGTRAVPVFIGVAAFAIAGLIASALELVAVAKVLNWFLEYAIIILVVVFHTDLRRILLRVGQRLLPQGRRQAARSGIGELVAAVDRLARARVGALFILEGEYSVDEVCSDAGRPVDAALRMDTLIALSVPHAANVAHDGAVLIRDFEIARAAVICPLTGQELDPRFGTRHRGAIGVTEETDALAIVLSEERGEVRVVQKGQISDPLVGADLETLIYDWLESPPPEAEATEAAPAASSPRLPVKPEPEAP
jgi:uncharacterized protein (TIGR00159 family)